ncbi:arginyl-tRNA synthetase [Candidatus Blochmanniella pennsylvanica str. BPEN]|uniref:Arginine--tRNA ligase n=1 Tax=Blochmanniella pennsylvanica (strain BPEN) TaxID=291272 RepID=SYR_BLOPB|nr:arginine--tRNA ligase [Candidatus Blochmannia pennsylvanicus]Q492L0.1 RecName: Full=Arginine--tRNA ligase; AltName: Full=Arginyl-tRNA synthetase; Short=ArgRS [Candidatus Blochmannia pennsylvanicus str. BPEN]AAZ41087.1 arginyl-tRNA synthetase [Candidatus Blochmannia pennsylvanicus str. BPEN]
MNIQKFLLKKIHRALLAITNESFFHLIQVQQSTKRKFGNYQINGLIAISKKLNIPIEEFAKKFIQFINLNDVAHTIKIEKPGFINIFLNTKWISNQINNIFSASHLGITPATPKTIVIDYSGPNVAKEMHVGHLRSTVIGDSIARVLSFLGHNVIRANHIGDWGTQFGMLIAYIEKNAQTRFLLNKTIQLSTLEHFYREAKKKYDIDPDFAELSRNYVLKLQKGDKHYRQIWKYLVDISILNNQDIYVRLNINLKKSDIIGESFYNDMLPDIVSDLKNKGLAVTSNGATVVFLENYHNKLGTPFGVIIQKKDGAYLYSTTDIACIKYRCKVLHADRIIYYIDSRQKQHLIQAWEIADKAGYIEKSVLLEHHMCGMLLGKDGKPFKTRAGNALKLKTLLDEALERARCLILSKNPNLKYTEINKLAHIISIGAIKYSELSKNRITDYIFDWNNMLNFEGNTAPYVQYACTRIFAIFKRSKQPNFQLKKNDIQLETEEEILLAICLLQFEEMIVAVSNQGAPHILCSYLYKLSVLFSSFYENCPIIKAHNTHIKYSRLKLALITMRTLKTGLNLLGIKTVRYM